MAAPNPDLKLYYRERAREYDEVYAKPERQSDLAALKSLLPQLVRGKHVLEVAAGTGYWTKVLAESAAKILATDIHEETLEVACARSYGSSVDFVVADAYALGALGASSEIAFIGFWWSHVPRSAVPRFLDSLHGALSDGSDVIVLDNRYVEGSNHQITRTDDEGNTYQQRMLKDGSRHEILKNFPDEQTLREHLDGRAMELRLRTLDYYWLLTYRTCRPGAAGARPSITSGA